MRALTHRSGEALFLCLPAALCRAESLDGMTDTKTGLAAAIPANP